MYAFLKMKIQEISKITGISKRTIHYYIKEGLIHPSTDPHNGYYNFSKEDSQRLMLIHQYRNVGLPLSAIRSILTRPVTAGYYLNDYAERLRYGAVWLQASLDSINYILEKLPLNPDFDTLYHITNKANIPDKFPVASGHADSAYNAALVNRCLWSGFLGNEPMSEYQQFLWIKLNNLTMTGNEDYKLVNDYLKLLPPRQLDPLFFFHSQQYHQVAGLPDHELCSYADNMLISIHSLLRKEHLVLYWKRHYKVFFAPVTRIFASDISGIVAEMSSFFMSYRKNIHRICSHAYEKLHSPEGTPLLKEIECVLGNDFEIDNNFHGELAGMASLPELYQKITE